MSHLFLALNNYVKNVLVYYVYFGGCKYLVQSLLRSTYTVNMQQRVPAARWSREHICVKWNEKKTNITEPNEIRHKTVNKFGKYHILNRNTIHKAWSALRDEQRIIK